MKKITLAIFTLIFTFAASAQSSTGPVFFSTRLNYGAQIDITPTLVTLILIGPSDGYLAVGFGVRNMINNNDCVIYTEDAGSTNARLTDRSFNGNTSTPTEDTQQDWTITENTVNSGTRRLVATRALNTGNADDFVFNETMGSILLAWAYRPNDFGLEYHGGSTRGATTANFTTLSTSQFDAKPTLSIYPNPSKGVMNINISQATSQDLSLEVYSVLGQKVYSQKLTALSSVVNTTQWNSGVYLVRLSSEKQNIAISKRFVKL